MNFELFRIFLPPSFCLIGSEVTQSASGTKRQKDGGKNIGGKNP